MVTIQPAVHNAPKTKQRLLMSPAQEVSLLGHVFLSQNLYSSESVLEMRERDEQRVVRLTIRADSILMIMVVLSSVSVIHPVNPLQAVVAGLSAVLHRYHCEVRHVFITVCVCL